MLSELNRNTITERTLLKGIGIFELFANSSVVGLLYSSSDVIFPTNVNNTFGLIHLQEGE